MASSNDGNDGAETGPAKAAKQRPARRKASPAAATVEETAVMAAPASTAADVAKVRSLATTALTMSIIGVVVAMASVFWVQSNLNKRNNGGVLIFGIEQLRTALASSAPYQDAVSTLYKIAPSDTAVRAALEPIEQTAATGVPTLDLLRGRLDYVSVKILVTESVASGNRWLDRAMVDLASAVSLHDMMRRIDGDAPSSETTRSARHLMQAGDLAGAVAEIETLSGNAAVIAGPWLDGARNRLIAMHTLDALDALVAKRFAPAAR